MSKETNGCAFNVLHLMNLESHHGQMLLCASVY